MPIATNYPSAYSVVSGTWNNPTNMYADDTNYMTAGGAFVTDWDIVFSGFGFNLPSNAIINSVTFAFAYMCSTTSAAATLTLISQYDGASRGTNLVSTEEPTSMTEYSTNLNGTWTADELNSTLCQALIRLRRISLISCTYSFDYVKITVDYTVPSLSTKALSAPVATSSSMPPKSINKVPAASIATTSSRDPFTIAKFDNANVATLSNRQVAISKGVAISIVGTTLQANKNVPKQLTSDHVSSLGSISKIANVSSSIIGSDGSIEVIAGNKKVFAQATETLDENATSSGIKKAINTILDSLGLVEVIATAKAKITSVADSLGEMSSVLSAKSGLGTHVSSSGIVEGITSSRQHNATLVDSLGDVETTSSIKKVDVSVGDALGDESSQGVVKAASAAIVDSIGDAFSITYIVTIPQEHSAAILDALGDLSSIAGTKSMPTNAIQYAGGDSNSITTKKATSGSISDNAGDALTTVTKKHVSASHIDSLGDVVQIAVDIRQGRIILESIGDAFAIITSKAISTSNVYDAGETTSAAGAKNFQSIVETESLGDAYVGTCGKSSYTLLTEAVGDHYTLSPKKEAIAGNIYNCGDDYSDEVIKSITCVLAASSGDVWVIEYLCPTKEITIIVSYKVRDAAMSSKSREAMLHFRSADAILSSKDRDVVLSSKSTDDIC